MPHKTNDRDVNREGPRDDEPEEIGKPHGDGSERSRDEQRQDGGPRYGGGPWEVADERGANERFGHARNDDADPSEVTAGKQVIDDDEWPRHDRPQTDAAEEDDDAVKRTAATDQGSEEAGQREGMGRGEKPRKPAPREKNRA